VTENLTVRRDSKPKKPGMTRGSVRISTVFPGKSGFGIKNDFSPDPNAGSDAKMGDGLEENRR